MKIADPHALRPSPASDVFPLLPTLAANPSQALVKDASGIVSVAQFAERLGLLAAALPYSVIDRSSAQVASMINLCEDRRNFLFAFSAALSVGHTTLLPASRAPAVVAELEALHARTYRVDDEYVVRALKSGRDAAEFRNSLSAETIAMMGFTSGSTGRSKSFPKSWASVSTSTALNARAIRDALKLAADGPTPWIVATVPPQHMYGMEFSVLLPMLGGMAVHSARPLFPADIAQTLLEVSAPRVLVTTPVHLRALVESGVELPPIAGVISATAPLDKNLAKQVEQRLDTILFEMFGSTETCIFATRRTAHDDAWNPYAKVEVVPRPDGALIMAPWFAEPMLLQDIVEMLPSGGFIIRGRNSDFIDVAGKRASLAELTRRLLAVPGVQDAIVFPPEPSPSGQASRVAALAVAPGLDERTVIDRLRVGIDPAFLPRPLVLVDRLPRNETGKLPREQLLECLTSALQNREGARALDGHRVRDKGQGTSDK